MLVWGSLIHLLWGEFAGCSNHQIAPRLLMREVGFQGDGADADVVREVAYVLVVREGRVLSLLLRLWSVCADSVSLSFSLVRSFPF